MLKLQILGIGCRRSLALKANVLEALKAYPLPMVSVEEITEVEQLMQFDISAVPALIVNGHVVAQDSVPTIEEIKQTLIRLAQTPAKPIPLKRILVPTDFSETARGAFRYAQELGAQFDSVVKVVHVYVHVSTNNLRHRRPIFTIAYFILIAFWVVFAVQLTGLI